MTNRADGYSMELESSSHEKQQIADAGQGHISLYASATPGHQSWTLAAGSAAVQWNSYRTDNGPMENGIPSISSYHDDQQTKNTASFQDGTIIASRTSGVSSMGASNVNHDYSAYFSNQNSTDPYAYAYQSHYYGYHQSSNDSSHQQVGAVQNTGAPYQPLSSFQNASSYVGPTSYSSTYYNPGDYQTTAGYQPAAAEYQSSDYTHQTNLWNDGNYAPHHYSMYTSSDANAGQGSSTITVDPSHYQQQYTQWAGYYTQTTSAVICPPGTEHVPLTSASAEFPVPDFNGGYPMVNSQPPPPGTTSWRRDSVSSLQGTTDVVGYSQNNGWQNGPLVFANHQASQAPSHFQKPLDSTPLPCAGIEDQQNTVYTHGSNAQFPSANLVPQNFQPPSQAVSMLDTLRVSKMQIPTNPRIATNLSVPKTDKESSTTDAAPTPAYINVPLSKTSDKVSSHDSAEGIMKGTFPPSLRAYVERSFARCKDDAQRLSNQNMMKGIITKASADGTLFTRDWDTEPLFPLPSSSLDALNKDSVHKLKRSPSRRTKSRWEPIAEEKMVEKLAPANHISAEDIRFNHFKVTENVSDIAKYENKVNGWSSMKFLPSQQTLANKTIQRPAKKRRFGDSDATENGDGSSDSDKEEGLTKYYSSAIALTNSPEERKRREHRNKRFEKGQERQGELKNYQPKAFRAGSLYNRRANISLLSKYEDSSSQAVEDIDWDSFTVKGTCQEIEKRYLRLTSAPDPATVRPEEVLEKALTMVQSTSKNYLYKCDQLKSIRQDLTVQRIHNELTVKVYETHARLALEAGDMPEYNQCQSQLKNLYAEGIKGCHFEFSAYNMLCVILHSSNNRELLSSMARLSDEAKKDEAVKHALAVRSAVTSGNYVLFFRLYKKAPNLSTCLMDLCVEKMRFEAVKCMSKSYRPTVPITFIAQVLGFLRAVPTEESEGKESDGLEDCEEWLRAHGAIIIVDNNGESQLDAKATSSSLYMPEPDDAVAHGDSSLAVDDFLTRAA